MKRAVGIGLVHVATAVIPFLAGFVIRESPVVGGFLALVGAMTMTGLLARAFQIDDECAMMRVALEDPHEADTLPNIPIAFEEPSTGVKHKVVTDTPPRVITWHGKRGNG